MVNIGIVGVGYLGSRHLNHLCSLKGVNVSGVWDSNLQVLTQICSQYNTEPAQSLEDLIERSDGIAVVTPTSTHFELGMKIIEAGKALFIEKPICARSDEAEKLVNRAADLNVPIQVGHIERYNKAFRALQEMKVRPRFIEAHRLSPWNPRGTDVAVVQDLMIHDLDLILSLAEGEPEHIHANGVAVITRSEDIATARIQFTDGMVANVTASRISLKKMRKIRLFGENEYISVDLGKGVCEYLGAIDNGEMLPAGGQAIGAMDIEDRHRTVFQIIPDVVDADAMRLELESFRDVIAKGAAPGVSGEDGLKALRLAERIVNIIEQR